MTWVKSLPICSTHASTARHFPVNCQGYGSCRTRQSPQRQKPAKAPAEGALGASHAGANATDVQAGKWRQARGAGRGGTQYCWHATCSKLVYLVVRVHRRRALNGLNTAVVFRHVPTLCLRLCLPLCFRCLLRLSFFALCMLVMLMCVFALSPVVVVVVVVVVLMVLVRVVLVVVLVVMLVLLIVVVLMEILSETAGVVVHEVVEVVDRGAVLLELAPYAYHGRPGRLIDGQRHQPH